MSTEEGRAPAKGRCVSVLRELMELRAQVLRAGVSPPGLHRFEELVAYMEGYLKCCDRNGLDDDVFGDFRDWLRDVRGALPEGWTRSYVETSGGDHQTAMRRFLDFVAEYLSLREHKAGSMPQGLPAPEHQVSILEVLVDYREKVRLGYPLWFYFGAETLATLVAFIQGYVRCRERNGFPDTRWLAFTRWLEADRHMSVERWVEQLLADSQGEQPTAMMRLLDIVASHVHELG